MYINHYKPHGFLWLFQPIQPVTNDGWPNSGDPAEVTAGRALRHGHVAAIRGRFWDEMILDLDTLEDLFDTVYTHVYNI